MAKELSKEEIAALTPVLRQMCRNIRANRKNTLQQRRIFQASCETQLELLMQKYDVGARELWYATFYLFMNEEQARRTIGQDFGMCMDYGFEPMFADDVYSSLYWKVSICTLKFLDGEQEGEQSQENARGKEAEAHK